MYRDHQIIDQMNSLIRNIIFYLWLRHITFRFLLLRSSVPIPYIRLTGLFILQVFIQSSCIGGNAFYKRVLQAHSIVLKVAGTALFKNSWPANKKKNQNHENPNPCLDWEGNGRRRCNIPLLSVSLFGLFNSLHSPKKVGGGGHDHSFFSYLILKKLKIQIL